MASVEAARCRRRALGCEAENVDSEPEHGKDVLAALDVLDVQMLASAKITRSCTPDLTRHRTCTCSCPRAPLGPGWESRTAALPPTPPTRLC